MTAADQEKQRSMSLLSAYRKYAPYTADTLIDACNAVLSSSGMTPMSKRTLRFYTAKSVVPRPLGSPKFARYGYEHLLTLLASRALQDQGLKLHEIEKEVQEIRRGQFARLEKLVEEWLVHNTRNMTGLVKESATVYSTTPENLTCIDYAGGTAYRTFQLSPRTTLHIEGTAVLKKELEAAQEVIAGLLKQVNQ